MACNIDHSIEDVMNKLESQKNFLPEFLGGEKHHLIISVNEYLAKNSLTL
jgi:hypothetical protein